MRPHCCGPQRLVKRMMTLQALEDSKVDGLGKLGVLRPIPDLSSRPVRLRKTVMSRFGSFVKEIVTPLYSREALLHLDSAQPDFSFAPEACVGLLFSRRKDKPLGYVLRTSGVYHLALPVYPTSLFAPAFYRVAGYMVTETGYVAVVRRRTLFWALLALLAGTAFSVSYLCLAYGVSGAWEQLSSFFRNLPFFSL